MSSLSLLSKIVQHYWENTRKIKKRPSNTTNYVQNAIKKLVCRFTIGATFLAETLYTDRKKKHTYIVVKIIVIVRHV